ncbi:MAG: hypothetical protein A2144_13700 [Chloroflexi bacterium RBG_16_50_9]|nr:MAG: hypothetical protein A2144_13700 [Chloroflexi bacterium RBG_16_50_9]
MTPDRVSRLKQAFARTCDLTGMGVNGVATDFSAIETAIETEKKSYDFYNHQIENSVYDAEREFYRTVASEEREHELLLLDYYEYLSDPAGWFVKKEHPSLDGG